MGVAFIEVKDGAPQNVTGKIKVTFIDSAGMVMSANGVPLKTIDITSVMSIGLSPAATFSPTQPYLFYIKAEADGYATNIKPVVVTQKTAYYIPIYMVKLAGLPSGNGLAMAIGKSNAVIGSAQTIVAGTGAQQLRLTIPEGARFSSEGREINPNSKLSYYLLRGNALDSAANLAFPGGFEVVKAVDETGRVIANPTNPSYFTTAGWFTMELKTETGEKVDAFSKPVDVEMPINRNVINPITNLAVKVGDKIPIWSMNNKTGVWKKEGETTVLDAGGGLLKTKYTINHLSDWNLDFMTGGCALGTENITVNYTDAIFNGPHYCDYIEEATNAPIKSYTNNLSGGSLTIIRAKRTNARLYVHLGNDGNTPLIGRSDILNCSGRGNLGIAGSLSFPCVELEIRVRQTANDLSNGVPICNNNGIPVWYKDECAAPYLYHAGATQTGVVKIASAGSNTDCFQLDFTNSGGQVVLPFEILYGGLGETNKDGTATGAGVPAGLSAFTYTYTITNTGTCGKKVQITINYTAINGLNNCING